MIAILDNYDSFTYNLVQYLQELGADIKVFLNDQISTEKLLNYKLKGLVLSPGPGRPENAGIMNELISTVAGSIPILGVCLGYQGIAQVHGGKLEYAPSIKHGKTSEIFHNNSTLFKNIESPFTATRYHSLVMERESIPSNFTITAETDDNIVMGLEDLNKNLFGVQFHPESILTTDGKTILKNFLNTLG
jgi:anthranilate synthase/aminodeoxychorismate synthase-like glutamine amidotransferase